MNDEISEMISQVSCFGDQYITTCRNPYIVDLNPSIWV